MCRSRTNYAWKISVETLWAIIDVGQGTMNFASSPMCNQVFPKDKSKGRKGKRKIVDVSTLGDT